MLDCLKGRLIDVERAQRRGDLIVLDAHRTLELFMRGNMPDAAAFAVSVGRLIADLQKSRTSRTVVRAYGEMVDVLWKDGKADAAIRLEMLWNTLAMKHGFALLCGYAMGNFYKQTAMFEDVCRQHAHIVPAQPATAPLEPTFDVQPG
jgi:hypothetical protein